MTLGGGDWFFPVCHYFQAAALALRYLFPGHCGVGRYDAYFQVTGVGGYDAYFQVAAGLAVTTLIPMSATEIGATLISRSL